MPEPYNYTLQIPSMFERISQLQNIDLEDEKIKAFEQDREMKIAAQNMAIEQQKRRNAAITKLWENPNATLKDYQYVASLMPKEQAEILQKASEAMNEDAKQKNLLFGGQVMAALTAGKPEVAIQLLKQREQSENNAGRDGSFFNFASKAVETDLNTGKKTWGTVLAAMPGGDKVLDAALKAQGGPSAVAKSEAEAEEAKVKAAFAPAVAQAGLESTKAGTKNIYSLISDRAKRFNLDQDTLISTIQQKQKELEDKATQLDPEAKKQINIAMADSAVAMQYSGKLNDLASKVLQAGGPSGLKMGIKKYFTDLTGSQDEWDQIRNEYVRMKNVQVMKNLPPGTSSDADIILALKGLPPENANAEYIASFLRGMAKLSSIDSSIKAAQADWINSAGSLARPKKDIDVQGMMVPAGTSFNEFMYIYLDKEQKKQDTKAGAEQAKPKSYYKVWVQ